MKFDRGTAIALFLLACGTLYLSLTMSKSAIRQTVGPEVFPAILSLLIMAGAVALFVRTFRLREVAGKVPSALEGVKDVDLRTQVLVILGMAVYIVVLEPLGYIIATALLCTYEAFMFDAKHWLRNVLSGLAFAVVVYFSFVNVLNVLLPKGILDL